MRLIKLFLLFVVTNISLINCDDYIHSDSDSDSDNQKLVVVATSSSLKSFLSESIQRIKTRYKLFSPSDYRAAVNKLDYVDINEDQFKYCDLCKCKHAYSVQCKFSYLYDLACMAVEYKQLIIPEGGQLNAFISALQADKDIEYVMRNKSLRYARFWMHDNYTYLIYSSEGRLDALRFLKKSLETQKIHCLAGPSQSYISGKCLGYPEEDLEFFWQWMFFRNKYLANEQEKFNEYIQKVWSNPKGVLSKNAQGAYEKFELNPKHRFNEKEQKGLDELKKPENGPLVFKTLIKDKADKWLEANSNIQQLEKDIQLLRNANPANYIEYDLSFEALMDRYAPLNSKFQEAMRAIKYLFQDGLSGIQGF